jgi:nucleoside-diphosphate-sugar epimerase
MLSDEKILITGPAGKIAFGVADSLVADNEVWGISRFADSEKRASLDALGVTTRAIELGSGEFDDLPTDFTYLLHIAVAYEPSDYNRAIAVNAEGTGLILEHCRRARAALVMSTLSVYKPHPDPWHAFDEDDPLGDMEAQFSPPYSVSKIAAEAVARYCARSFGLPVTIARMGAAYGVRGGLPIGIVDALAAGEPARTRWDPCPYSPIHDDDIQAQIEPLLDAATVPATIVNWCGDHPVSVQEMAAFAGEAMGVEGRVEVTPVERASLGSVGDCTRRISVTGPGRVHWRDGLRRTISALYPDRLVIPAI